MYEFLEDGVYESLNLNEIWMLFVKYEAEDIDTMKKIICLYCGGENLYDEDKASNYEYLCCDALRRTIIGNRAIYLN